MATENLLFGVFSSVVRGAPEILHTVPGLSLHTRARCWERALILLEDLVFKRRRVLREERALGLEVVAAAGSR